MSGVREALTYHIRSKPSVLEYLLVIENNVWLPTSKTVSSLHKQNYRAETPMSGTQRTFTYHYFERKWFMFCFDVKHKL